MVADMRALAPIGFFVLHIAGGLYALIMLALACFYRPLFQLLAARTPLFQRWHLPWIIVPAGLALVALLAAIEVRMTLAVEHKRKRCRWTKHHAKF